MTAREGGRAIIVQHCAVAGRMERQVRRFLVEAPRKGFAAIPTSVTVYFTEPKKRRGAYYQIRPDNIRYLTVESDDGRVLYDSRDEIPCDMAEWGRTRQRFEESPAITVTREPVP